MILLVAAGLFLRTFVNLIHQDLGFDSNQVLLATVDLGGEKLSPQALTMTFNEILDRIHAVPGTASVSRSFTVPLIGRMWDDNVFVDDPAAPKGDNADAYFNFITPEYLARSALLIQGAISPRRLRQRTSRSDRQRNSRAEIFPARKRRQQLLQD